MEEISTKQRERLIGMTDELIIRRKEILRLIMLVIVAALAMGFLTDISTNWLSENSSTQLQWIIFIASLVLLILCTIWALRSYAGDIVKKIHFEIIILFKNNEKMEVLSNAYYKPLKNLNSILQTFLSKDNAQITSLKKVWKSIIESAKNINDQNEESLRLLKFFVDLTEYLVFNSLAEFVQKSTTKDACYMPMGWTRPNYKTKTFNEKKINSFQSNFIISHLQNKPKQLKFLKGFMFRRKVMKKQKKSDAQYFEFIKIGHGRLRFSFSPFPVIMPFESRDVKLLARYSGLLKEDVIAIKLPFMLSIDFKGILMIRKKFIQNFAIWIEDMVDAINDNLDWQHCAQYDLERMVVELLRKNV